MKVTLTFVILIFSTLTSIAQIDSLPNKGIKADSLPQIHTRLSHLPHFTFKDIPLDGPLTKFVAKLKSQGFNVRRVTDIDAILKGRFTGEDVRILVQAGQKSVYGVTVNYSKQSTWKAIKTQYDNMKAMLTTKYGDPIEKIEKSESPYDEGSGLELYALEEEKSTYWCLFATKQGNGMIRLKISPDASLVLNYVDAANFLLASKDVEEEL